MILTSVWSLVCVGEAHLVAHEITELGADLGRDPVGDRTGGDPPGLGVADQPAGAVRAAVPRVPPLTASPPAELEADLRQLGGLSGAGLAGDHDDLVGRGWRRGSLPPATVIGSSAG